MSWNTRHIRLDSRKTFSQGPKPCRKKRKKVRHMNNNDTQEVIVKIELSSIFLALVFMLFGKLVFGCEYSWLVALFPVWFLLPFEILSGFVNAKYGSGQ